MNNFLRIVVTVVAIATLVCCSDSTTQYVSYTPPPTVTPPGILNLKAAFYQADLPSGNRLTLTTDQTGIFALGAYTIKNGSRIISSGTVSGQNVEFTLTAFPGSSCSSESITVVPANVTLTEADAALSGNECGVSLSGQVTHLTKIVPNASASMSSYITINSDGANKELLLTTASVDNVNFMGTIRLSNFSPPIPAASGTIVGTVTSSGLAPTSGNQVVEIRSPAAVGFEFNRVTNFSGHFFDSSDSIKAIHGFCKTGPYTGSASYKFTGITTTIDWIDVLSGATQTVYDSSQYSFDIKSAYTPQ